MSKKNYKEVMEALRIMMYGESSKFLEQAEFLTQKVEEYDDNLPLSEESEERLRKGIEDIRLDDVQDLGSFVQHANDSEINNRLIMLGLLFQG